MFKAYGNEKPKPDIKEIMKQIEKDKIDKIRKQILDAELKQKETDFDKKYPKINIFF
jgi:hypothetical protein